MKLSELIEVSRITLDKYGDIDVCVDASYFGPNNVIVLTQAQIKHNQILGIFDTTEHTVLLLD